MIAVVTGTSGFIGHHLAEALLAKGVRVRALLRPESRGDRIPGVSYHTADLLDDRSVRDSDVWNDATHVFHVAGVTKRRTLSQFRYGNVVPTANLLSAIVARRARVRRFVLVSSLAAVGPASDGQHPLTEDDTPRPVEAYGQSKLEAEEAAHRYDSDVPITVVRPGAVYGPRDVDFLKAFKEASRKVAFHAAPRAQALSLVYVRDLVEVLISAADAERARGRTYFAASQTPVTWRELYLAMAQSAGSKPIQLQLPAASLSIAGQAGNLLSVLTGRHFLMNSNKVALARPLWWTCDSSRAERELGWRATTPLEDGLRATREWYLENGWLKRAQRSRADSATKQERVS